MADPAELAQLADQLRSFPLFERFSEEQAEWVAERARVVELHAGTELFRTGDVPAAFYVLVEGEIQVLGTISGRVRPVATSTEPGAWAGLVPYVFERSMIGARLTRDSRLLVLAPDDVRMMIDTGFPLAKHLMLGVTTGTQRWAEIQSEEERLLSLGQLSAGLAHELNNPASATRRAADQLQAALAAHEAAALDVACTAPRADLAERLAGLRADVATAAESSPVLGTLQRSDREDAVSDWLVDAGLDEGPDVAPGLVDAGLSAADLDRLVPASEGPARVPLLRWLVASTESAALIREIGTATTRISDLVKSVKAYSYMDRADVDDVDVRKGLDDTVKVLKAKLEGIAVERDYDPDLPTITAKGGSLNQVWTNLIDNAADALQGRGTIRLGAHQEDDHVVVTVEDDGPGIPEEAVHRVFEPFFTTKGVGEGTGLGLDIANRIVTQISGGDLTLDTRPGRTVFRVTLPMQAPPS